MTCPHCGHYCTGKSVFCLPPTEFWLPKISKGEIMGSVDPHDSFSRVEAEQNIKRKERDQAWIMEVLLALDQLGNAGLGGDSKETISSRLGKRLIRNKAKGIALGLVKVLDILDENHCLDAVDWGSGLSFVDMFGKYVHHREDDKH